MPRSQCTICCLCVIELVAVVPLCGHELVMPTAVAISELHTLSRPWMWRLQRVTLGDGQWVDLMVSAVTKLSLAVNPSSWSQGRKKGWDWCSSFWQQLTSSLVRRSKTTKLCVQCWKLVSQLTRTLYVSSVTGRGLHTRENGMATTRLFRSLPREWQKAASLWRDVVSMQSGTLICRRRRRQNRAKVVQPTSSRQNVELVLFFEGLYVSRFFHHWKRKDSDLCVAGAEWVSQRFSASRRPPGSANVQLALKRTPTATRHAKLIPGFNSSRIYVFHSHSPGWWLVKKVSNRLAC